MPIATSPAGNIYFAHVPKAGGSSVQDYLVRRFGPLWLHENHYHARRSCQPDIIQALPHLSATDASLLLPPDLRYSFAVVRNPMSRIISEYRFQLGISKASRVGFSTWLRAMIRAAQIEPRIYENHIRPQTDMVPEGARSFRLEDGFDALVAWLDEITGTPKPDIEMGHFLKRKHEPVQIFRQDAEWIAEFYAADYERFGYAPPDTTDLPSDPWAGLRSLAARPSAQMIIARHHRRWMRGAQPSRSASSEK